MESNDATSNDIVRTYLKKVLEHVIAAGHSIREFNEFILDKFGAVMQPYLRQFLNGVSSGQIKIKGLTEAAKTAIVGHDVSTDERAAMVREEAYYLAEKRGFTAGHEVEDWVAAEAEINNRLAEEAGLIAKGGNVLAATATNIENDLKKLKSIVTTWLEENYGSVDEAIATEGAAAGAATKTAAVANKAGGRKKAATKTVAQASKQTSNSQASKKTTTATAKKVAVQKKVVKKEPV